MNLFVENVKPDWWDGKVHMSSIPGKLDFMALDHPLPCGDGFIEIGYQSDGATVMFMRSIPFLGFPKWRHPMETFRHDKRCEFAAQYKKTNKPLYKKLRKIADVMFKEGIGRGGTWWEQQKGYVGVRIGAFF